MKPDETRTVDRSGGSPRGRSEKAFLVRVARAIVGFILLLAGRPLSLVGTVLVGFFVVLTIIGPWVAPYPYDQIIRGTDVGLETRRALTRQPPSGMFLMGTDRRGRDIFSRILWGARDTIGLPLVATLLSVGVGSFLGLLIGFIGGSLDNIVSRILDSLMSIPILVLALVSISTIVPMLSESQWPLVRFVGPSNLSLVLVIVIVYVPIVTRVARSATLGVRGSGYIEEARLRGESVVYILLREIFPSVLPTLVVETALRLSYAIILVTSLGFLGLGVQPPSPEWGRMVLDARSRMLEEPWELWFPVASIAVLIISANLMSDGLRRVLRNEQELE
jgi:peptide/nickel transport system permease protein